jgi:enolase
MEQSTTIRTVTGREILDSRGNPTVEVEVRLSGGALGRAAVPSGASTGAREALELRDEDPHRYGGKGVRTAVNNANTRLAAAVHGKDAIDQAGVDRALIAADGSPDKSRLGANAILGVSMAVARAAAAARSLPVYRHLATGPVDSLPVPMTNVINGGAHAANALDFQEFMIVPSGAPTMAEGVRMLAETFHALRSILKAAGHVTSVGDEGGYAPEVKQPEDALAVMVQAIERAGYKPGRDVVLAMDPAASELHENDGYVFRKSGLPPLSTSGMIDLLERLVEHFPVISIEDGLAEDDWDGWRTLTKRLGTFGLKGPSGSHALAVTRNRFIVSRDPHQPGQPRTVRQVPFASILTAELGEALTLGWFILRFAAAGQLASETVFFQSSGIEHFRGAVRVWRANAMPAGARDPHTEAWNGICAQSPPCVRNQLAPLVLDSERPQAVLHVDETWYPAAGRRTTCASAAGVCAVTDRALLLVQSERRHQPDALVFAVNATCLDRRVVRNIALARDESPSPELLTLVLDLAIESVGHQVKMPVGRSAAGALECFLADARRTGGAQVR